MLTNKKKLFIHNYIRTLNATQSAKDSGYSLKTSYSSGQRLLKEAEVSELIHKGIEERKRIYRLTKDDYTKKTLDLFEAEQNPSVKQRYWEMLGKIGGHLIDKQEVKTINTENRLTIDDMVADRYSIE